MTTYGLTEFGFVPKTLEDIRAELEDDATAAYGLSIDVSDSTPLGQLFGILSERLAELWELAQAVNASQDPDGATATALDALCALTGTLREPAVASTVDLLLIGTTGTAIAAGSGVSASNGVAFTTDALVTLVACATWSASTVYTVGLVRSNATRIYRCITAGTSAGAGGPTTTAADITDGTAHWKYLGEGLGVVAAAATATATGPLVANAYDVATIDTPISGWNHVVNILDAVIGSDIETDESLRVRRESELAASGTSTPDAIRADVLGVDAVTAVTVFYNNTDVTDADGVPPHAVEVLVQGGADQEIIDQVFASVAAGIATYGSTAGTAADSQGTVHTVSFTRPTAVPIWVIITVEYDVDLYPADGDAQIEAAIIAYGDALATGHNARASAISAQAFGVTGVIGVTSTLIGLASPPVASTTIAIALRELATFDTSRITVNSSAVTP